MNLKFKFSIICLVILAVSVLGLRVYAVAPSTVSVDIIPASPIPEETATINLSSLGGALDGVSISWFVAGKKVASGTGMKSFSVKTGVAGSETKVKAVIDFPSEKVEKDIIIRPSVMVMLWQATDSYVPPFYRGKAMPTADSEIKVVAMPEIRSGSRMANPKDLVYYWKRNYTNEPSWSGYGKNFFKYTNDFLEDADNIEISAYTPDGQYSSEGGLSISSSKPEISFYRNDENLGILWENALQNGHKVNGSEILVAEPYYVAPKEIRSPSLVWNWSINDSLPSAGMDGHKNWLPIRVEGGVSGFSNIRLELENTSQLLSRVGKGIDLEF